jgi:translation elongation factor EF-G
MEYSHYEEVPGNIQSKIIAAYRAEKGEAAEDEE